MTMPNVDIESAYYPVKISFLCNNTNRGSFRNDSFTDNKGVWKAVLDIDGILKARTVNIWNHKEAFMIDVEYPTKHVKLKSLRLEKDDINASIEKEIIIWTFQKHSKVENIRISSKLLLSHIQHDGDFILMVDMVYKKRLTYVCQ
jgi:hypothetical protein